MAEPTRVFVAGGGSAIDSISIDKAFCRLIDTRKPLLYIPNAMENRPYEECLTWITSTMTPFGIDLIEMCANLQPNFDPRDISGVYIGGGNTAKLLQEIVQSTFSVFLKEVFEIGLPIYGGSAGAIILGEDIRTTPEASELDSQQARGFQFIPEHAITCHYKPSGRQAVAKLSREIGQSIIAIPERSGACISKGCLTNFGTENIEVIFEEDIVEVMPEQTIRLARQG